MKANRTFLVILLLVVIASAIGIAVAYSRKPPPTSCPEGQWSPSGDFTDCKVCTTCLLPKILDKSCTQTTDATCKNPVPTSCPPGKWSPSGNFTDCEVCKECTLPEIVDQPCTQKTNTTCKVPSCPPGQWSLSGDFTDCKVCTTCVSPKIVDQPCTQMTDATCKDPDPTSCPPGQWSPSGNFKDCEVCKECTPPNIIDQPCTQKTNTTCKPDPTPQYENVTLLTSYDNNEKIGISTIARGGDGIDGWEVNYTNGGPSESLLWWDEKKLWISSGTKGIYISEDGKSWTNIPNIVEVGGEVSGLACSGSMCIAGYGQYNKNKQFLISDDGRNWSLSGVNGPLSSVTNIKYGNGLWVAGGMSDATGSDPNKTIMAYSEDGINWTASPTQIFGDICSTIEFNGTIWVALSAIVADDLTVKGVIAYSEDGKSWTKSKAGDENGAIISPFDVTWNGREWLAIYVDGVYASIDGKTWSQRASLVGDNPLFPGYVPSHISWDGEQFIVFGNTDYLGWGGDSYVSVSADGSSWTTKQVDEQYMVMAHGKIPVASENYFVSYAVRGPMASPYYSYGPSSCDRDTPMKAATELYKKKRSVNSRLIGIC